MEAITMKKIQLNKQHKPDFEELDKMLNDLDDFLNEESDFKNKDWVENLNTILDFQDEDGSFKLFDTFKIPTDARVDFIYTPTYICSAILIKAYLTDPEAFNLKAKSSLYSGLKISTAINLRGHGYEALKGQIDALKIFQKAGLKEFIDLYPDFCPEFSEMIEKITAEYQKKEDEEKFLGPWGESYEAEIKQINKYFSQRQVFVYGTLMTGEANHHYLDNSKLLCKATIDGYDMYDVGYYPAIVPGDNQIRGELYQVPIEDLPSMDRLEGEGKLYLKKCERVSDAKGVKTFAFTYIYLKDTENLRWIPAWNDYVWYVSYGSNMLEERFLHYIKGGYYGSSTPRQACYDTTLPEAVKTFKIPYNMYFGNQSRSWNGGGVSFLDTSEKGFALGVAYLITREQFEHVSAQENGGRRPQKGYGWYENIIDLGELDGFEVKTITNEEIHPYNEPSTGYLATLYKEIRQNWPEKTDEEIEDYLTNCIR